MESIPAKEEGGSRAISRALMFSMRIVHLDYYMATPLPGMDACYSHFQGRDVRQVPVVRIFGSTTLGQKTCLHLHKAFPYFYVAYDQDLPQEVNEALAYVRRLASAVEKALKIASSTGAKRQHVQSCSLVRGRKFYGYYPNEQLFVKIVFIGFPPSRVVAESSVAHKPVHPRYYPHEVSRMSMLLLSGGIMNHKFQPYEAHIPYLLQLLIDYNLYGMGQLHLSSVKFRNPLPGVPLNITNLVKQVKLEHSCAASAREAQDLDASPLQTAQLEESGSQKKKLDPILHVSPPQIKDELPNMNPLSKLITPDSHQSTPVTGSQPELWLNGSVCREWVWPVAALSQEQGPYLKQTTCELEADTSVEDILNRCELLFRPLQQTGPDVKMVQSLTQIWEEERLRSGEEGPAGTVVQYEATARTVAPLSPLEQSMRDVLFQIARAEEHQERPTAYSQDPSSGPAEENRVGPWLLQDSDYEVKVVTPSGENTTSATENNVLDRQNSTARLSAQEILLECTQVANGEVGVDSTGLECQPIGQNNFQVVTRGSTKVPGNQQRSSEEHPLEHPDGMEDNDQVVVDVEAIKSHLSQRFQSQELDKEVAEFLRWMGGTQEAEDGIHEDKGCEIGLSQMFGSPGMDSALLKALADYESASQKECEAILECAHTEEEGKGADHFDTDVPNVRHAPLKGFRTDSGLMDATGSTVNAHETDILTWKDGESDAFNIPQIDGACDDEDLEDIVDYDASLPSKKPRVGLDCVPDLQARLDVKVGQSLHHLSEGNKEVSVRDMMRRRRERRPHNKEMSCSPSPSSLAEDAKDATKDLHRTGRTGIKGVLEEQVMDVLAQLGSKRKSGSSAITIGGPAEKYPDLRRKMKLDGKDKSRIFKFGSLPIVKINNNNAELGFQTNYQNEMERGDLGCGPNEDLLDTDKQSRGKSLQVLEDLNVESRRLVHDEKFKIQEDNVDDRNSGDDRDSGGGQRPSTYSSQEFGEERGADGSCRGWPGSTSTIMRPHVSELRTERDADMKGTVGVGTESACQLPSENRLDISQQRMQSCNTGREEESVHKLAECFPEIESPMADNGSIKEPCRVIPFQEKECVCDIDLDLAYPVNEEKKNKEISVFSNPSNAEDSIGKSVRLSNAVVDSTQYFFTDMSDDSHDSFDSRGGQWVSEHKWDETKAFVQDEEKEEFESLSIPQRKQLSQYFRNNSTCLPEEDLFVADLIRKAEVPSGIPGSSSYMGSFSEAPSTLACIVGRSSSCNNLDTCSRILNASPSGNSVEPLAQSHSNRCACNEIEVHDKGSTHDAISFVCPSLEHGDSKVEPFMHVDASGSGRGAQTFVKEDIAVSEELTGDPAHFGKAFLEGKGQALENQCAHLDHSDDELFPLTFHQRPPDKVHVLASFKELISNFREEGAVYYGNVKDVSDRPNVMAGLIFDVKSREAAHLRPFVFGGSGKRSIFEQGSRCRRYIELEHWGAEHEMDSVIGIPSHFRNDGTVLYLISPAKAPPAPLAVRQWVLSTQSLPSVENVDGKGAGGERVFTMDVNTGTLVPINDIGQPETGISQEDADYGRPASPKYDEKHVLSLVDASSAPLTCNITHTKLNISSQIEHPSKGSCLDVTRQCGHSDIKKSPLPDNAQTLESHNLSSTSQDGELKEKARSVASVLILPQDRQNKQPSGQSIPKAPMHWRDVSQLTAIPPFGHSTPLSQAGFRDPASTGGGQQVTLMSIEVFAETRGDLLPDPRYDAIGCIVLVIHEDGGRTDSKRVTVVLIHDNEAHSSRRCVDCIQGSEVIYLPDEAGLLKCFARLIHLCDPDILLGWEIQGFSLGLLAERAANLGISLLKQLSRIASVGTTAPEVYDKETGLEELADLFDQLPQEKKGGDEPIIEDEWGRTHGSGIYVGGRIILNLWRIMRGEVKLGIYSLEAVAEAVLRRRVPQIPWRTLTRWFSLGPGRGRFHCLEYFIDRARINLEIMDQLDLVNRTAELARVFGIDFYSVFSRGSQFRVESMMARLAHTQNYILVSPTRQQVAEQPAMECLPLVMEPESRFYTSPVIVLDFQSLYPSMIIAYNLCFCTCLGKLVPDNPKVLGVTKLFMESGLLESLKEGMTITPNGVMFTPPEVRPGVLPRLLQEILSTRIMVKKAMKKLGPDQRVLQRVLNARQFALKLIANVTYGYTAAGFSGRMPCAEIADSIVQCGRLTLERAIHLVNSHPRWGARVVYGDTDSMFVLLEGRTREEAHALGQEIAAAVTEINPSPVTLKMEKVYQPCVLLTKKRYVGYSYESASQSKPTFDAKGIETIRRDSCPAVAKALEHSLRILFESRDLSQVKQYLQRQWGKILSGRVSLQDFIFAKEVRLGTYSSRSPVLPPAAIVASKAMAVDPRAEPRYAERIRYVVVHGEPGARLVDMVVDPLSVLDDPSLRLHDTYYITKQIIPACQRVFMLVGADLRTWFSEMPRVYRPPVSKRVSSLVGSGSRSNKLDFDGRRKQRVAGLKHGTIDQYYLSRHCTICGAFTRASELLCSKCIEDPRAAALILPARTSRLEREFKHLQAICRHCGGGDGSPEGSIACVNLDCSVLFERRKVHRELQAAGAVSSDLGYYPPCLPELF